MDNSTNGRNNARRTRERRGPPLQTPVNDQGRYRLRSTDLVQEDHPLRERDPAVNTAPARPTYTRVATGTHRIPDMPGPPHQDENMPPPYVPPHQRGTVDIHRRNDGPFPPIPSALLQTRPLAPPPPGLGTVVALTPTHLGTAFEPQLQPYPGSVIWSPLLRGSQPDLAPGRNPSTLQPPIGTGSRSVAARAASQATAPTSAFRSGSINQSASDGDTGVTQLAFGQNVAQHAVAQTVQQFSLQSASQSVIVHPIVGDRAAQSTAPHTTRPAVSTTVDDTHQNAATGVLTSLRDRAVDFIKAGGATEPGDDVSWLYQRSRPLPIRTPSGGIEFVPAGPRLVAESECVARRYAAMTLRSIASDDEADLLDGSTYLLPPFEVRRYPHEMVPGTAVWAQDTSNEQFADIEGSSAILIEAFHKAGEALLYYNPEFFQMSHGARLINIKVDDIDSMYHAIKSGEWTSQPRVNERIQQFYVEQDNTGHRQPLYLLFSISGAKQYCAMGEMVGPVRTEERIPYWPRLDSEGVIPVRFIYVKNAPFSAFTDLLTGNKDQSVVNMWNGMVFEPELGRVVMERYVKYAHRRNILVFPPSEGPGPLFTADMSDQYIWIRGSATGMHERLLRCLKQEKVNEGEEPFSGLLTSGETQGLAIGSTVRGRHNARRPANLRDRTAFWDIRDLVLASNDARETPTIAGTPTSVAPQAEHGSAFTATVDPTFAAMRMLRNEGPATGPFSTMATIGSAVNTLPDPFVCPDQMQIARSTALPSGHQLDHDPSSMQDPPAQRYGAPDAVFTRGMAPKPDFKPRDSLDYYPPPTQPQHGQPDFTLRTTTSWDSTSIARHNPAGGSSRLPGLAPPQTYPVFGRHSSGLARPPFIPQQVWPAVQQSQPAEQVDKAFSKRRDTVAFQAGHSHLLASSNLSTEDKNAYRTMQLEMAELKTNMEFMQRRKDTLQANLRALEDKARLSLEPFNRRIVAGAHGSPAFPDYPSDTDGGVRL
ncbi:hypothetical protein AMS68_004977 [Peltaster fructicola]|uniref:YTH domain-containing protein n=1 Tax=Peltaster fructicola TaxID=286661 RepID=A0A6H0XYG9_9PEZI|nr:hypothetical protein AMS68_004977 [Peltaster fructicola]